MDGRRRIGRALLAALTAGGLLTGCDGATGPDEPSLVERFDLEALGAPPYPADNPYVAERVALGRLLFFDPLLGGERDVSCGTCHHPDFAFADGRGTSVGVGGTGLGPARTTGSSAITAEPIGPVPRGSPTVLDAAQNADETGQASPLGFQFWDGRARGLEEQALIPLASRLEMAGDAYAADDALDSVVARLRANAAYVDLFATAFPAEVGADPAEVVGPGTLARAIAAFERELGTGASPYDRYVRGEAGALSDDQFAGLELFFTTARCAECHAGPMFSDFTFRVVGAPQVGPGGDFLLGDDAGREQHTLDPADRYAFRTPSLRNVELTAPYMHDGAFTTLEQVVSFYDLGSLPRHPEITDGMLDPIVRDPLELTADERAQLVAFLEALTDPGTGLPADLRTVPDAVPSGLRPVLGVGE